MEVHQHTHTPRKKWTHYFWEFFMLFLAVTLGFFVENQREHYIEHKREKQFMLSLFNDIKADTVNLSRIIASRDQKERALDSLSNMMNSSSPVNYSRQIYFYAASAARTLPYRFVPNDGTILQLKNSGAFRLIRKRAVVDSISKYDINVRNLIGQWTVEENLIDHYRTAAARIFYGRIFEQLSDENAAIVRMPNDNPRFQPYTAREVDEWTYRLYSVKSINRGNRRDARIILKQATRLLNTLKQVYHLE